MTPVKGCLTPKGVENSQVKNHSSKGSIPPLLTILANIAAGIGDKVMFSQLQSVLQDWNVDSLSLQGHEKSVRGDFFGHQVVEFSMYSRLERCSQCPILYLEGLRTCPVNSDREVDTPHA